MKYRCSVCGKPINYRAYCADCYRAYLRTKKRFCLGRCGQPAPSYQSYCSRCHYARRKERFARPWRYCSCGTRIPKGYQSDRCQDCRSMDNAAYRYKKKKEELSVQV